jgi:7-cyano-7-deazaguanine synthase
LVLLSGGQDSTTCLYCAKAVNDRIVALTINYGQRHQREIAAALKIADMAGANSHEIAIVPEILRGTSPLTDLSRKVHTYESADKLPGGLENTFVPARNVLFLTIAANRAYIEDCNAIYIGVSQEDYGGYPDCRQEFLTHMESSLASALERPIKIVAPLINKNKKQTVLLAKQLEGCWDALAYSHTCYQGSLPPCGKCHACLLRARGFQEAGVPDPLLQRLANTKS